ncbi:hypothetical protein L3X38_026496 [Prunus dulcis]|uniref:Uncharacterized protein n=1 Tax=Prunus dulcis TaxID=3755 RepID=A0AAD4YZH6_PRUDU|nr:hypothetical protein L3X38_026496 [Prunus dulcis]
MPYFASSRGPVTKSDSLLLDNEVAIGVARSLVTPRDVRILGTGDDNRLVSDVVALCLQNATTITSVGHRLIAKSYELEALEILGKRKRDHDGSFAEAKRVIFGSSSDKPPEVVRKDLKEDIQRAKLKSPMVDSGSATTR